MISNQHLGLNWPGKGCEDAAEPQILIERPEFSYGEKPSVSDPCTAGNILIHGENLLALRALLGAGYGGKVKCIYIDPPYNTGSAFEFYEDMQEHARWLSFMKLRLELLRALLSEDGVLFVQIDDSEMPYLAILLDEIFRRENRINTICVNMSNPSGVKISSAIRGTRFPKIKEYILLYAKDRARYRLTIPKLDKPDWDAEYNLIVPEFTESMLQAYVEGTLTQHDVAHCTLATLKQHLAQCGLEDSASWRFANAYRLFASKPNAALLKGAREGDFSTPVALFPNAIGVRKLIRTDFNRKTKTARIELVSAAVNASVYLGDHWGDIVTTGGVAQEGGVAFPNGKKPEKLLHRVLACATAPGDLVLDCFLGSGTTAAVAHKMGRRYIGIELGAQAYTHCVPRLRRVVDGVDLGGITQRVGWRGGGGFRFYELGAPT